jgi:hypothetical protein
MVLGVRRLANAVLARARAVHRYDQQVHGHVLDMIITREEGQRGLVRVCMHGHGMAKVLPSPHFNRPWQVPGLV